MGNLCSCFKKDDKEYNDHLIRDKYCPKCRNVVPLSFQSNS